MQPLATQVRLRCVRVCVHACVVRVGRHDIARSRQTPCWREHNLGLLFVMELSLA